MKKKFTLLLLAVSALTARSTDSPRPNIRFAIADDWGWPHAGAFGCEWVTTPNIDALARSGEVIERFFVCAAGAPACMKFPHRS